MNELNNFAEPQLAQPLVLADTRVRQDVHGRYCLNDLHKAAVAQGANVRSTEPNRFFRSSRVHQLRDLLEKETTPNWRSLGAAQTTEIPRSLSGMKTTQNLGSLDATETTPIWGSLNILETTPNWRSLVEPVSTVEGREGGTYVCIQLVIAYGQFVSAAFDLKVINIFLAVVHKEETMPRIQSAKFWNMLRPHWDEIARLALAGLRNKLIAQQVQRSAASVGACLRRMYDVGYLNPVHVYTARLKPSTAARWALQKPVAAQWGMPVGAPQRVAQSAFDFAGVV